MKWDVRLYQGRGKGGVNGMWDGRKNFKGYDWGEVCVTDKM